MNRNLLLISISLFTWGIGEGMFFYFQPVYLQDWGADPIMVGSILGAVGISMGIAQVPAGYLADRFGPRPLLWTAWIIGVIAALLMAFSTSLPMFVAGMLMYGVTAFSMTPLNTYISFCSDKWSLGRALTLVSFAYNSGAAIGPLIGGFIAERYGLPVIYRIAAAIFVVSAVLVMTIQAYQSAPTKTAPPGPGGLFKSRAFIFLLVLVFFVMFAGQFPQSLTPNFLRNERGLTLMDLGMIGAAGSLGNALISLFVGGIAPRAGLAVGSFFIMIFSLLIWQGGGIPWYFAGYFFIGGYRLARAMAAAYTRPLIIASQTGVAFGWIETANALAVVAAPVFAGIIFTWQPAHIYPISIFISFLVILLILNPGLNKQLQQAKPPEQENNP